jgi:hypothetical protein
MGWWRAIIRSGAALLLATAGALAVVPRLAAASTIVYQCGPAVCAVDPDTASVPRQLTPSGRVAGVTRDGATAAWVAASPQRIVVAPVAGGAESTLFAGEVYDFPSISPSGSKASWTWFLSGYGWYTYAYTGPPPPPPAGQYPPAVASSTYQTTAGWLGEAPIISVRGSADGTVKAQICRAAAGGPVCDTLLASDPDSQLSFPDGAPDGSQVVAIRGPIPSAYGTPVAGTVALYSIASGARVRDLMPGATGDTHPVFSADGSRVAFERDGGIWVVDVAGGAPRRVATGATPFWGGARTSGGDPAGPGAPGDSGGGSGAPGTPGQPLAPSDRRGAPVAPSVALIGRPRVRDLAGRGGLRVRVAGAPAGRVQLRLTIARAAARRLGLGRRTMLAAAVGRVRAGQAITVRLRPQRALVARLGRARLLVLTLRTTWTPNGGRPVRTTTVVRLRR